jgi:lysophospholipase L1-like esterase
LCSGQTPLACALSTYTPAIALILIGTNDLPGADVSGFQTRLTTLITTVLANNTIPILSTLPRRLDDTYNVAGFNAAIATVATANNVPLIDLNAALETITNYGIGSDNVHLSWPSPANTADFTQLDYGYNLRNALCLQALYQVRNAVIT